MAVKRGQTVVVVVMVVAAASELDCWKSTVKVNSIILH